MIRGIILRILEAFSLPSHMKPVEREQTPIEEKLIKLTAPTICEKIEIAKKEQSEVIAFTEEKLKENQRILKESKDPFNALEAYRYWDQPYGSRWQGEGRLRYKA